MLKSSVIDFPSTEASSIGDGSPDMRAPLVGRRSSPSSTGTTVSVDVVVVVVVVVVTVVVLFPRLRPRDDSDVSFLSLESF
jgi:hypothetical protein